MVFLTLTLANKSLKFELKEKKNIFYIYQTEFT